MKVAAMAPAVVHGQLATGTIVTTSSDAIRQAYPVIYGPKISTFLSLAEHKKISQQSNREIS